jgi:hypothetical protein
MQAGNYHPEAATLELITSGVDIGRVGASNDVLLLRLEIVESLITQVQSVLHNLSGRRRDPLSESHI